MTRWRCETLRAALALADPAILTDARVLAGAEGDTVRAITLYRQAAALDPVNPMARSFLAYANASTGELAQPKGRVRACRQGVRVAGARAGNAIRAWVR